MVNYGELPKFFRRFYSDEFYQPRVKSAKPQKYRSTVVITANKKSSLDEADWIIFKVYESSIIKEGYQELCDMPFEAFCKLYERVTVFEDLSKEASNEAYKEGLAKKRRGG